MKLRYTIYYTEYKYSKKATMLSKFKNNKGSIWGIGLFCFPMTFMLIGVFILLAIGGTELSSQYTLPIGIIGLIIGLIFSLLFNNYVNSVNLDKYSVEDVANQIRKNKMSQEVSSLVTTLKLTKKYSNKEDLINDVIKIVTPKRK